MTEWVEAPLSQLVTFQKGRKVDTSPFDGEGYAPYLGASGLEGGDDGYASTRFAVIAKSTDTLMLWDGERSGLVGYGRQGVVASTVSKLSPSDKVEPKYLYYALSERFDWIQHRRTGTGVPHVPKDLGRILKLRYPSHRAVQQRVATILSGIDTAIQKTEALIAKYQQIKAGLMHDLFTRGVLPNGQLRPPREQVPELYQETAIGWIPREWESLRLDEVVDFWDGRRVPLKEDDRAKIPGQIPYYGASGVIDWIDRWLFDDELILLGEDGENIVSRNLPLAFKVTGKCWVNNHAHILKTKSGQNIDFWVEQLEWRDYSTMTSGSAQPKITQKQLSRMIVAVPRESEQTQVAEIAVCFEGRMEQERKQLEKLRQQKLGLMHDLLTGKVQVKVGAGGTANG